jgi:predicted transcriptional regulator
MLNLPYSTVYYQRPEVRERRREYMREYRQRPEVRERRREYRQRPEVKERAQKYYQRPEVRERRREYMREYRQRPEVRQRYWLERYQEVFPKMTADLNEFINLTPNAPYTIFVGILKLLEESKLGLKYYQIFKRLEKSEYNGKLWKRENILWELNRLREMGLISYNNRRYALTDKGRELIKELYEI